MKKIFQVFFSKEECISRNRKFKSLVPQALFWQTGIVQCLLHQFIEL